MRKARHASFSHRRPSASPSEPTSTLASLHVPTPDASHLGDDDAPLRSPQVPATLAHLTKDLEHSSRVKDSISSARAELVALREEVLAMSGGRRPSSKRRIRRVDPFDIDYALIGGARRGSSGIGGEVGVRPAWVTASEDGDPYAHQEEEIFVAVGIEELQKHKKVQMAALRMYVEKEFIPRPPPPKKDKPRGVRRQRQMIGGKSHKVIPESAYGQLLLSQMEKSKIPRPYSTDISSGGGSGGGGELSRQTAVDKADAAMDKRRYLEREALAETKRVEQEIRRRIALTHLKRPPNVVEVVGGAETKKGGGEEKGEVASFDSDAGDDDERQHRIDEQRRFREALQGGGGGAGGGGSLSDRWKVERGGRGSSEKGAEEGNKAAVAALNAAGGDRAAAFRERGGACIWGEGGDKLTETKDGGGIGGDTKLTSQRQPQDTLAEPSSYPPAAAADTQQTAASTMKPGTHPGKAQSSTIVMPANPLRGDGENDPRPPRAERRVHPAGNIAGMGGGKQQQATTSKRPLQTGMFYSRAEMAARAENSALTAAAEPAAMPASMAMLLEAEAEEKKNTKKGKRGGGPRQRRGKALLNRTLKNAAYQNSVLDSVSAGIFSKLGALHPAHQQPVNAATRTAAATPLIPPSTSSSTTFLPPTNGTMFLPSSSSASVLPARAKVAAAASKWGTSRLGGP